MSKITQIQNELKSISPERFQQLCNAYLQRRGYDRVNPIGSVIGADKVATGTPDTLVTLPNGKYVFVEQTTQQTGVIKKFRDDIEKCFDEEKTKIPVSDIQEIVLCHNTVFSTEEEQELAELCRQHRVALTTFGMGPISYDLYQKYPGLARDFLGVEVDTGQILEPGEFIAAQRRNRVATPLDTTFRFRDDEVVRGLEELTKRSIILLSGRPGLGKSRLALECARRYQERHPSTQIRVVADRGPDLFEDVRVHFGPDGEYLIIVDDANRVSRPEYVLDLLSETRTDRDIRIIATVRDYAAERIREAAKPYGGVFEIELTSFTDEQIQELAREEFGITNHHFLERIAAIAGGNPRLALMVARLAVKEQSLASIADVSSLYELYFDSIRSDLDELSDGRLLQVAAIVGFLGAVDRSNASQMGEISDAFGLSPDAFWDAARRLHDLEVVALYENEVVRPSDQVLATYLFYLAFLKRGTVDFSVLLKRYFPRLRHRLIDALNPTLAAFGFEQVTGLIRPHLADAWGRLEALSDTETLLHLADVLGFIEPTRAATFVRDQIRALAPQAVGLAAVSFQPNRNRPRPSLLSVLETIGHLGEEECRIAVELAFEYLDQLPMEAPNVLGLLLEGFGFDHNSDLNGFAFQRVVVDAVTTRSAGGTNEAASRVFLVLAGAWLKTEFQSSRSKGRSIVIRRIRLPTTPEVIEIRRHIWKTMRELWQIAAYRDSVLGLLQGYSQSGLDGSNAQLIAHDAAEIIPFVQEDLDPSQYTHCRVAQAVLRYLAKNGVRIPQEARDRFEGETLSLAELLLEDWDEIDELGFEEHHAKKLELLRQRLSTFGLPESKRFLQGALDIFHTLSGGPDEDQLQEGVARALLVLAEQDPALYREVIDVLLQDGNRLRIGPWQLVPKLIEACGASAAHAQLLKPAYDQKTRWLFAFYQALPDSEITTTRYEELINLYHAAKPGETPPDLTYLDRYREVSTDPLLPVVEVLAVRAVEEPAMGTALRGLFVPAQIAPKELAVRFRAHVGLLKRAYFAARVSRRHADHSGQGFSVLLDLDPGFAVEYVDWVYGTKDLPSHRDESLDFAFLWRRDDYAPVITAVVERVYALTRKRGSLWFGYIQAFFAHRKEADGCVPEREDELLAELIGRRADDRDFMRFLFSAISQFSGERRRHFIALFLQHNAKIEDFRHVQLEPHSWTAHGSFVPVLERRIEFFESLFPLVGGLDFLDHKQVLVQQIHSLREQMEREKKKDFVED